MHLFELNGCSKNKVIQIKWYQQQEQFLNHGLQNRDVKTENGLFRCEPLLVLIIGARFRWTGWNEHHLMVDPEETVHGNSLWWHQTDEKSSLRLDEQRKPKEQTKFQLRFQIQKLIVPANLINQSGLFTVGIKCPKEWKWWYLILRKQSV